MNMLVLLVGALVGALLTVAYLHYVRSARRKRVLTPRQWVLGFGPIDIPPTPKGRPGTMVRSVPQVLFKPERLVIPKPEGLLVADIKCGAESMFMNANPVPAHVFGPTQVDASFTMKTLDPGQTMMLEIINETDKIVSFSAVAMGPAIADWHEHPLL